MGTLVRKSVAVLALMVGTATALSGCDMASALRHEDAVAQSVVDSGGATKGANDGSNKAEPGGQNWTTSETNQTSCDSVEQTLTGVRVGKHDGFDRVVFDLSGNGKPCYRIYFDPNPIQDGSGNPVDLGNHQAIRVEISGLGPDFPTPPPGYEAELTGPAISFARFDTFFEGVATNFVAVPSGVNAEYAVSTQPGKLIVDVRTR